MHILNLQVRIIIYVRLWSGELVVVVDWGLLVYYNNQFTRP